MERLVEKALSADPGAPPDPVPTIRSAAKDRSAFVDDVYASIAALEKRKPAKGLRGEGERRRFEGKWRLVYTSGTKTSRRTCKAGFGGSYFPVPAIQSFDVQNERIRKVRGDLPAEPDRVLLRRNVWPTRAMSCWSSRSPR